MKPITEPKQIAHYSKLVTEMMLTQEGEECEFNSEWIRSHKWKVVPVESMARIPQPDIPRLISVLNEAGCHQCFAITTEPLGDMPTCYVLSVDEADFRELNRELGPFRFALTDENRSWAISCNEWYNLFASEPELLEALLGKPIEQARQEYLTFASDLAKKPDEPLLQMARRYAAL
ncbi:MAG TPA: hypothetical protein VM260_12480 [Pirellula sp.]|nr:hypothetical protein [Pirellula sp.]